MFSSPPMSALSSPSRVAFVALAVSLVVPSMARANPEPSLMYGARGMAMGGTGTAYLDTPAGMLKNPANLAFAPSRTQLELSITNMLVSLTASFSGPGREQTQHIFVPLPFFGATFGLSRRLTVGAAFYVSMGFGGSFDGVERFGTGTPCLSSLSDAITTGNVFQGQPAISIDEQARNADYCPSTPHDESVTLAIFELAIPFSIRILDNLSLGLSLRLPYGILKQSTTQEALGALYPPDNPQGTFGLGYAVAQSNMSGFGLPGVLFGVNYRPHRNVALGFSYRSKTRVDFSGTTNLDLNWNELIGGLVQRFGSLPIGWLGQTGLLDGIEGLSIPQGATVASLVHDITHDIPSKATWYIPHAFDFGVAWWLLERRLMLTAGARVQLHKEANKGLTIHLDDPLIQSMGLGAMTQPFDWKNVFGWQLGAEYQVSRPVSLRLGMSGSNSATPSYTATQFGVAPGYQLGYYAGAGLRLGHFLLDLVVAYGAGTHPYTIPQQTDANGSLVYQPTCRPGQPIKTGCPGTYGSGTWFFGLSFTYRAPVRQASAPARSATASPSSGPESPTPASRRSSRSRG